MCLIAELFINQQIMFNFSIYFDRYVHIIEKKNCLLAIFFLQHLDTVF